MKCAIIILNQINININSYRLSCLIKFYHFINRFLKTPSAGIIKSIEKNTEVVKNKDLFFDLVVSWKQTRDLAVLSGCAKAVEVADQMFPYLSPEVCSDKETVDAK